MDDIRYSTVTVGAGASLSGALAVQPSLGIPSAFITAATWDAAKLTFQGSVDGTNYFVITNEGTEYECASVTGAKYIAVDPKVFLGVRYIKVQSGTSGAAVAQADATIVTVVLVQM